MIVVAGQSGTLLMFTPACFAAMSCATHVDAPCALMISAFPSREEKLLTARDAWVVGAVGMVLAGPALSDDTGSQPTAAQLEEITITAAKMRSLEQFTPTGSRLGLSQQELPATLDVIDNDEMIGRGFYNVQEAADSQPGVTSGDSPGDQSQFSMRGSAGNQIATLRSLYRSVEHDDPRQ